jgi:hypothetical protein
MFGHLPKGTPPARDVAAASEPSAEG